MLRNALEGGGLARSREASVDDPLAESLGDRLGLRLDLKLAVDLLKMKGDSAHRDTQLRRRRLVVMAFREQLEKPKLVRRQAIVGRLGRTHLAKERDHLARDLRGHGGSAADRFLQALEQLRRRRLLDEVAGRSRAESVEDALVLLVDREDEQDQLRESLSQNADALDARDPR